MKIKVALTFPSDLKDEPIIYYMVTKFKVVPNIVEASFSTEVGWAYLILEGKKKELNKLFDFLKAKMVKIDQIEELK